MQVITLEKIPSQEFDIILNEQYCTIKIYQRGDYMYMDLDKDGVAVGRGMICLSNMATNIARESKITGWLMFFDLRNLGGTPNWQEFNDRYVLAYATSEELDE